MIDVSVVMGVYNGAATLNATLESVLQQEGCSLEFIVVDDGSTDETPDLLDAWAARDARIQVIRQANAGLTAALARGCSESQGEFIARQDCGDVSLQGRLARQCAYLRGHRDAVMVASAVRFVGPANEPLFVTSRSSIELRDGLSVLDVDRIKGPPHHGGTMFTRSAYFNAGGYRLAFIVAQDIDLWLRLHELGLLIGDPEIGYEARMEAGSISARRRVDQFRFAALGIECAKLRRAGRGDEALLSAQASPAKHENRRKERLERAKFLYFVGSCLRKTDPAAAKRYYLQAFREHPLLVKSLLRYLVAEP